MNITELKGVGEKTSQLFSRLNVYTVEDLVGLYPRDYDVYEEPALINELNIDYEKSVVAIDAVIARSIEVYNNGRVAIISTTIRDERGSTIKCSWYNMPYLKSTLRQGMRFVFRGSLGVKNKELFLQQPQIYTLAEYNELKGVMQPVYPLTKGLSNKTVIKAVKQALSVYEGSLKQEYIPEWVRRSYELAENNFAAVNIHFPKTMEDYIQSRKRITFQEFLLFILSIRSLKETNERRPNEYRIPLDARVDSFIEGLSYSLTEAQARAWEEISANMAGDKLMSRLVQGDVGSGKTIIAILAMLNTAYSGYQSAMMVPTEVLARQQYESINKLFKEQGIDIGVELLVGSMTASAKRAAYERIRSGEASIIVGTHALIQEKVEYNSLALVITDEQHRFGVNQRRTLSDKGLHPHVLVMSATPIPRTLAIIVYGDLDISVIDQLPANRLPIKNCVVDTSYRPNAYSFITKQVKAGHQAYVICPMVEESDGLDLENVCDYTSKLRAELPNDIRVEYLHGKMKPSKKNEIYEDFLANRIQVLVSTTVVEVGVNVPNATVIMIENSDRFGLAQLHQLRGRVGRGGAQSYCIFVSGNRNKKTLERLKILEESNDGFVIAKKDLELRGPGDFFGVRQSGDMDFGLADIFTDSRMLKAASECADRILEEDPLLEAVDNMSLRAKVKEYTVKCLEKINI